MNPARAGELGGRRARDQIECGLARAVSAPPRIGALRRIARHIDDETAVRDEQRQRQLHQRHRRDDVDLQNALERFEILTGHRMQAAQQRGVVDQHGERSELTRRIDEPKPDRGVGHVPGDRDHASAIGRASEAAACSSASGSRAPMTRS